MFTAYDVTLEVRNRGHNEYHNNIKNVVHDYFGRGQMIGYNRTLVPVAGAPIPPWVYHRTTDDPTTYLPRKGGSTSPAQNKQAVAAQVSSFYAQGQADADDDDDDGTATSVPASMPVNGSTTVQGTCGGYRQPDARGTVCVPADFLRAAGFKPKDVARVIPHGADTLEVCKSASKGTPALAEYTVDENNNVRITKHVLQNIKSASTGYDFVGDSSKVLVTAK